MGFGECGELVFHKGKTENRKQDKKRERIEGLRLYNDVQSTCLVNKYSRNLVFFFFFFFVVNAKEVSFVEMAQNKKSVDFIYQFLVVFKVRVL